MVDLLCHCLAFFTIVLAAKCVQFASEMWLWFKGIFINVNFPESHTSCGSVSLPRVTNGPSKALATALYEDVGPKFPEDLPSIFAYSNLVGGKLVCKAVGEPKPSIQWLTADFFPVPNIPSVREVDSEGSLLFKPFEWPNYRPEIHLGNFRCKASNSAGAIISTEIRAAPVLDLPFQIKAPDVVALKGNVAIIRCSVPSELREFVDVTSWDENDIHNIYPNAQAGEYLPLPNGDLYVFHVEASDGFKNFACRVSSKLNNRVMNSRQIRIQVRGDNEDAETSDGVELLVPKELTVRANAGDNVYLPCAAQGNPPPSYTWFREIDGELTEIAPRRRNMFGGGVGESHVGPLLLSGVRREDSSVFVCRVNNSISRAEVRVTLQVYVPLRVQLTPQMLAVDVGRSATFHCHTFGGPVNEISWFKDGRNVTNALSRYRIQARDTISVMHVEPEDEGMFQCFASNDAQSAQDSAQLRLGSVRPELIYRFAEQTLQPGPSVSMKCTAVGNPPPQFTWTLDGFPLPENDRFLMGQYVTIHDTVISHVNITVVQIQDGGHYSCQASNIMGSVVHSARLNIYGPPFVRSFPTVKASAGKDLRISCPVSGHPIESISWERGGSTLPTNRKQRVFPNGTLIIENVQRGTDDEIYTCTARNRAGLWSSRDLNLQVVVPPRIMPFRFLNDYLQEGRRLSVFCQILEGDKPIEFTWLHNAVPISSSASQGVSVRIPDEYSSTLVIDSLSSAHNGDYSCVAENPAGKDSFTDTLTVNVPPKWTLEPKDVIAVAGRSVTLECQAAGHPAPKTTWKRALKNHRGDYKELRDEGGVFVFDNGTVHFKSIKKTDEGQFLCEASNGIGSGLSKVIQVKVNGPAEILERDEEISVRTGDRAVLACKARGDLPIEIQWSHKHQVVPPRSSNRHSTRQHETLEGSMSELLIADVSRLDDGIYNCRASNTFGTDLTTVKLEIQEPPEQPSNLHLIQEQSRFIHISWTEGFNGNSPLINFIVQYKFPSDTWTEAEVEEVTVPATQTTAVLPGLQPSTTYHIRVLAQNSLGFSRPSDIIQVTTAEEAPEGAPTDVHILPVSSTQLRVQWSAPEKSLWHGNLLGYYIGYREIGLALSLHGNDGILGSSVGAPGFSLPVGGNGDANGYHFKTVEMGTNFNGVTHIENLKKYTTYAVVVQAFNSKGSGPLSQPVLSTTVQDVPSMPPEKVSCSAVSSTALKVTVEDPPLESQNGVIQGYKVMHQVAEKFTSNPYSLENWDDSYDEEFPVEIKVSTSKTTTISGLHVFRNYSISALAFTTIGDGVLSTPILCQTDQDVPSAPADFKVLLSSRHSVLLSWLPPAHPNGKIVRYTIHTQQMGKEDIAVQTVSGSESRWEMRDLNEDQEYEFWMTASTKVGEGKQTSRLLSLTSNSVPARIATFGRAIRVPWRRDVFLQCDSVGIPEPMTVWTFNGKTFMDSTFTNTGQAKTGSWIEVVDLKTISREQAGNYTCVVSNVHGKDWISYDVQVLVPPQQPNVSVLETFHDSLRISWAAGNDGGSRVKGYVLNYKLDDGDWEEYKLDPRETHHLLQGLVCGSKYQLFLTAFNKIGTGKPSEIVEAKTEGGIVPLPRKENVLSGNMTCISIRLDAWRDSLCPVLNFRLSFKPESEKQWTSSENTLSGLTRSYTIENLQPGTKYDLKVEATNHAGTSVATFTFATTSLSDQTPNTSRENEFPEREEEESSWLLIFLPLILALFTVVGVISFLVYYRRTRRSTGFPKSVMSGKSGDHQVIMDAKAADGLQNHYCVFKGTADADPTFIYQEPLPVTDYGDDPCPYATFQLPEKTPGRPKLTNPASGRASTLSRWPVRHTGNALSSSGNVYSGPYNSVEGAQVKQLLSEQATLPLRETYRSYKGRKAMKKEIESLESDTIGSTDSEVKNILTLHMPISEYSPVGLDCEGEKRQQLVGALTPSEQSSDSSDPSLHSSDERGVFKESKSRVQKSGCSSMKRRVRSSSGYSSHTEETSFSYPERVQPPPIFSDAKDSSDEHIDSQSPMMVLEAQGRSVLDVNSMKTKRKSRNSGDSSRRRNRLTHIAL